MNNIPVDSKFNAKYVASAPHLREGLPVLNNEGVGLLNVSFILEPDADRKKLETLEVRIPTSGIPKLLNPYETVTFDKLVARSWAVDGRSGISFSATAIHVASNAKATS